MTAKLLHMMETTQPARINLKILRAPFGYSRGHIIALFKSDLRTTPQQFLLTHKVGLAAAKLLRGRPVSDIVYDLNSPIKAI